MGRQHRNMPISQRLSDNHRMNEVTGCWEWIGSLSNIGYASVKIDGKCWKAHRLAWVNRYGSIPDGLHVLHKCDVRHCVNPDHLFLGTHQDNMADRDAKCRNNAAKGVNSSCAKLAPEKAFEIRWLVAGGATQRELAKKYGVSQRSVAQIVHHRTWRMECHD